MLSKNVRCVIYSFLYYLELLNKIANLSKKERQMLIQNLQTIGVQQKLLLGSKFQKNFRDSLPNIELAGQLCHGVYIDFSDNNVETKLKIKERMQVVQCFNNLFKHQQNVIIVKLQFKLEWFDQLFFSYKKQYNGIDKIKVKNLVPIFTEFYLKHISYFEIKFLDCREGLYKSRQAFLSILASQANSLESIKGVVYYHSLDFSMLTNLKEISLDVHDCDEEDLTEVLKDLYTILPKLKLEQIYMYIDYDGLINVNWLIQQVLPLKVKSQRIKIFNMTGGQNLQRDERIKSDQKFEFQDYQVEIRKAKEDSILFDFLNEKIEITIITNI